MKLNKVITNVLFGSCVIIATQQANAERPERYTRDAGPDITFSEWEGKQYEPVKVQNLKPFRLDEMLDTYQLDCSRKAEQVKFLQSFRQSKIQLITARFQSTFTPTVVKATDPVKYDTINKIGKGDINWIIDQKLYKLKNNC